jgi:3-hydroxyisobutyrate dehydrogenase-like beta-hydroxyacid dehydrogenase
VTVKIGFIGIGQMGKHMSRRLLEAGYPVVVHDINRAAATPLIEKGAGWADSPAAVGKSCRVVITSLPQPQDVEQVVYGKNGLMQAWRPGDIYIDMSTNSPSLIRRIASDAKVKGAKVLDAPVSGGVNGAAAGTLTIMVGGEAASLKKVRKVFEAMGQRIFPVGPVGSGNVVKLVNNLISLECNSAAAEGFALGVKAGIDPALLLEIIKVSTGDNWSARQYPNTVFQGNFEPGFKISLAYKDIKLALELGRENGVPLPVGAAVSKDLENTIAAGFPDKGVDAVILTREKAAGVKVRSPKRG